MNETVVESLSERELVEEAARAHAEVSSEIAKVIVGQTPPGNGETRRVLTCSSSRPSGPGVTCTSEL